MPRLHRNRRGGIVKGCLGTLAILFIATVALVVVMASMAPKVPRPEPATRSAPVVRTAPPPDDEKSGSDVVRGLDQKARREIYQAWWKGGIGATSAAEKQYSLRSIPVGGESEYIEKHQAVYKSAKAVARREILKRFKIDGRQLDDIEAEGDTRKWPVH